MFDYKEAERRVRCGAVSIKRKDWKGSKSLMLWFNILSKTNEVQISKGKAFSNLSDTDRKSLDWIDPAE